MAEISVVMPVFNGENYLDEAILSVLNQSFVDFEFLIIVEFGSSKKSIEIIEKYASTDSRIVPIYNEERLGISESMNIGLRRATGKYIARMDADDISGIRRFEVQKLYMDEYPNIGICGIRYDVLGEKGWIVDYYSDPKMNRCIELFGNCFRHPSIMIRKQVIDEFDLFYNSSLAGAEDVDYFLRASLVTDLHNILDGNLFYYRRTGENASLVYKERDISIMIKTAKAFYLEHLELDFDDSQMKTLLFFSFLQNVNNEKDILKQMEKLNELLHVIEQKNDSLELYDKTSLRKTLSHRWLRAKLTLMQKFSNHIPRMIIEKWRKGDYYREWMA